MNKNFTFILAVFFAMPSFADSVWNGSWTTQTGKATYYAEDRTANYTDCTVKLEVASTATTFQIKTLSTACKNADYWDFDQALPALSFPIDANGALILSDGQVAGIVEEKLLNLKFEQDGSTIFLNIDLSSGKPVIDWSMRSFDDLNYDVTTTATK